MFHIKMIKTANRSPTKLIKTSVRYAGQGAAESKIIRGLNLAEVKLTTVQLAKLG
jgi:hypothetical protein